MNNQIETDGKEKAPRKKALRIARNVAVLVLSLIIAVSGVLMVAADQMMNRIHFVDETASSAGSQGGNILAPVQSTGSGPVTDAKSGLLGGLYHDDAVTNILLLGVDDYRSGDIGRTDSMIMVSVDNRRQKLKLTSLMRDLYVAVPGYGSTRINSAYSIAHGGAPGARLLINTIEANFGTDIDRFVVIDNSAFDTIIEDLGGVQVTLTQGEADLINSESGDPRKNLSAGTFLLSGKQAHYYCRIRKIGNDYARTERQRKVITSIVSALQQANNLGKIYGILNKVLPLVTTNFTKDEILSMAANSLSYLNYPVSQCRIPADGEFTDATVTLSGMPADVLVPNLERCKETLADFVYENEIPKGTYPAQ